ncbi:hypothetical protein [Nocardia sp. NPDC004750]
MSEVGVQISDFRQAAGENFASMRQGLARLRTRIVTLLTSLTSRDSNR